AIEVGVAQIRQLGQARPAGIKDQLDVIVADGHYGNHLFFGPLQGEACAALARMRRDRVLYRDPGPYPGRGRPAVHGERFAFKEPDTWPTPDESVAFNHERWGQVRLRRWNKLHAKQDAQTHFDVILAEVHLERNKPPDPLWLGYLEGHTAYPLQQVWSWFDYRWPIEPSIRFRKQYLYWTLPYFQDSEACDRWTALVDIGYWQLFLARQLVSDQPLPWQKAQTTLTPGRVLQRIGAIFAQIGNPAHPPQKRGKSPGWPKGRPRTRPKRYKVTKRGKHKLKTS
ncbi:MAG TPA: transposase, partial [Candidatus Saccharimonadales bacterium]|nr:transposase [Candidatus Saccharimonadales bacterium]